MSLKYLHVSINWNKEEIFFFVKNNKNISSLIEDHTHKKNLNTQVNTPSSGVVIKKKLLNPNELNDGKKYF